MKYNNIKKEAKKNIGKPLAVLLVIGILITIAISEIAGFSLLAGTVVAVSLCMMLNRSIRKIEDGTINLKKEATLWCIILLVLIGSVVLLIETFNLDSSAIYAAAINILIIYLLIKVRTILYEIINPPA